MKIRNGFVSNSSSSSYLLCYEDENLLKNAEEILEFLKKDLYSEVLMIGKDLGDGRDVIWLNKNQKKLILRFPEHWKRNGEEIFGVVVTDGVVYASNEYGLFEDPEKIRKDREELERTHQHVDEILQDNWPTEDLTGFSSLYFLNNSLEEDQEELPVPEPYVILYDEEIYETSLTKERLEELIEDESLRPLYFCFRNPSSDYFRTLLYTGDELPSFSLTNQIILPVYPQNKESLIKKIKELNKMLKNKELKIYSKAFLAGSGVQSFFGWKNFHMEAFFGTYSIIDSAELGEEL